MKNLDKCPICGQPISKFVEVENSHSTQNEKESDSDLAYDKKYAKSDRDIRYMDAIHQMAITGESIVSAMYTDMPMSNWDEILILGNQLNPQPLESDVDVNTQTVIGKSAKKPLVIESPVYITHMSKSLHGSQAELDATLPAPLQAAHDGLEVVFTAPEE